MCIYIYIYTYVCIYIYIYMCCYKHQIVVQAKRVKGLLPRRSVSSQTPASESSTRPLFVLRIFKFGVWVKRILKRRRWIFLVYRLISERSDLGILTQRFLV